MAIERAVARPLTPTDGHRTPDSPPETPVFFLVERSEAAAVVVAVMMRARHDARRFILYYTVVESYDCSQNFMTAVIVIIMTMTAVMPFLGPNHDYDCSHSHNDYDCSHSHDYRCSSCSHNFDYDCSHDYSHDCRTRSTVCNL